EGQLVATLARQVGMEFVELAEYPVDRNAVARVPASLCRRYTALPIAIENDHLVIAMADPGNVLAVDDARALSGMQVRPVVATYDVRSHASNRVCRAYDEIDDLASAVEEFEPSAVDLSQVGDAVEDDAPIVRFVNILVQQAISDRASDIHIEPSESDLRVRYRIDGVLHEMQRAPKQIQSGVISRLKIMSDIDIAERRKPQDGRMSDRKSVEQG